MSTNTFFKHFFTTIMALIGNMALAQEELPNHNLTHHLSPEERLLLRDYDRSFTETTPPVGSVRAIAEWEPVEGVLIAYSAGFGMPISMIRQMSNICKVTTIVSGTSEENTVRTLYTNNSVNLSNCNFLHQDPDSWWTRDYSPWYIAVNEAEIAIIDFPYNRPSRPNDDNVPVIMATSLGEDLYGMNVIHTGGNMMFDGYGAGVSTDLVWEENPTQSAASINTKFQNYLGVTNYHVTADPLADYIKHVDCWGKYLDVDKVMIAKVPVSDSRYNNYEAVAQYFSTQNCSWGYPYEVVRVLEAGNTQSTATPYTNSLILNNTVFVPQTGSSYDAQALTTYQQAMPGYQVVGVSSSGWYNTDALHCRTYGIADRQMLHIHHTPLHGNYAFQTQFEINAHVVSYGSGSPVSANYPKLTYRQDGGSWTSVTMSLVNATEHRYQAYIPGLSGTHAVDYYIEAMNDNNKTAKHPTMGTADPHHFTYSGGLSTTTLTPEDFKIFPNPSSQYFEIVAPTNIIQINIRNSNGQKIFHPIIDNTKTSVDITDWSSGIYFIEITTQEGVYNKKLIKN